MLITNINDKFQKKRKKLNRPYYFFSDIKNVDPNLPKHKQDFTQKY